MSQQISRRSLSKGTAWALPAVIIAPSAQAVSASQPGILGTSDVEYGAIGATTTPEILGDNGVSFTTNPSGGSATFTNVTVWYYLPWSNATFTRSGGNTTWTTLQRDTSVANQTSATTGITYYAYKTTFVGPYTGTSGPQYDFTATSALPVPSKFTGGYYYHIVGTVNGVMDTSRPIRPVTPSRCTNFTCTAP